MRAFLFAGLACHALAQAPALPPRFEIPAGTTPLRSRRRPRSSAFPAGTEVEAPGCRIERTGTDVHCVTGFDGAREIDVSYKIREGVGWIPELAVIETGDRSKAVRLLETEIAPGRITFQFAGPAGTEFRPRFWHGDWIREGNAGAVRFPSNEGFTKVSVGFRNKS